MARVAHSATAASNSGAAAPSSSVSAQEDPSERCELRIFRNQPGGETIIVLTAPGKMTEFRPNYYGTTGRLFRELARQAVLVAVREELNLPVRDTVVGDPAPKGQPAEVIEINVVRREDKLSLLICRGEGEKREVLLEKVIRSGPTSVGNYKLPIEALEPLTRGALPEVLGKVGLVGKAAPKKGDDRVPDGVEERLGRMTFPEPFAVLRTLHAAQRTEGPSPRRLAALSRAYAHLGLLTEFQWDAASVAYKARALLYAQRLVALEPKSPQSFWHRAYATALAGIPWMATDDMDTARGLAEQHPAGDRPKPPGWVALIDAWCRYAFDELAKASHGPDAELAALLRLMALEHPPWTDVTLRAARAAINASPECFRAHDALCMVGGIANLHAATTLAPKVLSTDVPRRTATVPGLPEAARKAAERSDEAALTRALDDAAGAPGDAAEPSWGALAKIVRETRFAFTCRRLEFMCNHWNVPTDEYWEEVRPLVADHRFRPFLESYVTGPFSPAFQALVVDLDTTDLGFNFIPLLRAADRQGPASPGHNANGIVMHLADWTVRDLSMSLDLYPKPPSGPDRARKLLAISPNSPLAMAHLIQDAWGEAEKNVDRWQKVVGDHPTFVAAMARHYVQAARTDDAEKALKRSIEFSPDLWAYQDLADIYRKRGDLAGAKKLLDDFLAKTEDHDLDHAKVRVSIANDLMKTGRYAEAWPYAEAAAQTGAGWAMTCAQNCAAGLKNWEAAEGYARASSERYPGSMWTVWFVFCERTGHGDIAAARAWTKEISAGFLESPELSTDTLFLISYVQLLCGDKAKAAAALRRVPKDESTQVYVTSLAAAADLAGADEVRDAALERFCTAFKTTSPKSAQIFQLVRDALAGKKTASLDLKAVDDVIESIPRENRGNTAFEVAARLTASGHLDLAKRYWLTVSKARNTNFWWRVIALSILRDRYRSGPGDQSGPREV
jgi:tetratricopeptide (TPR) repeat protein